MTLEEIRILARDEEDAEGDTARNCMGGAEKQELAALLVRAVEETRAMTAELDRLCSVISDEDIAIVEPVVDSARSFLHELGVEA